MEENIEYLKLWASKTEHSVVAKKNSENEVQTRTNHLTLCGKPVILKGSSGKLSGAGEC